MLPPNVIIIFHGNHASIPSGWTRDTRFDSRFVMHSNTGVGGTSGSNTHTHTISSHLHALVSHTHLVTFGQFTGSAGAHVNLTGDVYGPAGVSTHTQGTVYTSTSQSANSSSDSFTSGTGDSYPPYYTVIYIKSSNYNFVPNNGIVFSQTSVSNLLLCDGSSSTPNLINKFLRGAGTGANAGSTGGTSNHIHSVNHTHTSGATHNHTGTTGVLSSSQYRRMNQTGDPHASYAHTHNFTTSSDVQPIASYSGNTSGDALIYPPYFTLKPYINITGSNALPQVGSIVLTTETTIPTGWALCNGSNGTPNLASKFIYCSSTAGSTGGATTHTHTNFSHTHSGTSHTHNGNTGYPSANGGSPDGGSSATLASTTTHTHTLSADAQASSFSASNMVFGTGSSVPAYIEAKYIQMKFMAVGSSIINSFIN